MVTVSSRKLVPQADLDEKPPQLEKNRYSIKTWMEYEQDKDLEYQRGMCQTYVANSWPITVKRTLISSLSFPIARTLPCISQ